MKLYKKYAFSLTELLIVLVVLAVLFAALAPIITKRRSGASFSNESVWNYVSNDDMMDAFYDPGVPKWTSSAYIGLNPATLSGDTVSNGGKVVIRSSSSPTVQRQLQFRYGTGDGVNAGTFLLDSKGNALLGANFTDLLNKTSYSSQYNTAAGIGVLNTRDQVHKSVAYGSYAMASNKTSAANIINTAVGHNAARAISSDSYDNIFVGSNSGRTSNSTVGNIAIGATAYGSLDSDGDNNVMLGSQTGSGLTNRYANNNVFAGTKYYAAAANKNTIIGYGVYASGHRDIANLTAVGNDSCTSFTVHGKTGTRTCIGYSSGGGVGNTPSEFNGDRFDRVFLGGYPLTGFAGRSVLEVHNVDGIYTSPYKGNTGKVHPVINASVVLNSNLAVRGNFYVPNDVDNLSGFRFTEVSTNLRGGNVCTNDTWRPVRRKYTCRWGSKNWKPDPLSQNILDSGDGENLCTDDWHTYSFSSDCPQLKVYSDLRLKAELKDNHYGLNEVLRLNPYKYTFKSDKDNVPQVGVVAQDLQKIFPTAVRTAKDGYLHIRWDEMFYAAINAIKTLGIKVEKIATDISQMESDVKELKSDHKLLQKRIASLNSRAAKLERK